MWAEKGKNWENYPNVHSQIVYINNSNKYYYY